MMVLNMVLKTMSLHQRHLLPHYARTTKTQQEVRAKYLMDLRKGDLLSSPRFYLSPRCNFILVPV